MTQSMTSSARLAPKSDETPPQPSTDTELFNAFQLINRASYNTLLAHRGEFTSAFNKLCMVYASNKSPGTISPVKTSQSRVSALLQKLNESQTDITKFLSLSEVDAVERSDDPSTQATSENGLFRRGLYHRCLALDYEEWEMTKFRTSRVDYVEKNLREGKITRNGHVNQFISVRHGLQNQDSARKACQHGIKMLVFERLCQGTAVSALVNFAYTKFYASKLQDLPLLKQELDRSPWIPEILREKEGWYQTCQKQYDSRSDSLLVLSLLTSLLFGVTGSRRRSGQLSKAIIQ